MLRTVYLVNPDLTYPEDPPFHPSESYPELVQRGLGQIGTNRIHGALRELFRANGLDVDQFGTPNWNPLGCVIRPGQHVVLKPNWVYHFPDGENSAGQLTTQGPVVRAVLDYVVLALGGQGRVTIADGPIQGASFKAITRDHHMDAICEVYRDLRDLSVSLLDLRREEVLAISNKIVARNNVPGDPMGHVEIDLGDRSYLEELAERGSDVRFSAFGYAERETNAHHRKGVHRYLIARTVLDADVVVNLPKMKTHKKAGVTGALKNIVGINGSKAYLAHTHRDRKTGGDEFSQITWKTRLAHFLDFEVKQHIPLALWALIWKAWKTYKRQVSALTARGGPVEELLSYGGSWYGNQTIWRMVYDINTILLFADKQGSMTDTPQRKCIAVVDGIVGCEGEGPLEGVARREGVLILGQDPIEVDACIADLMGFDSSKIPLLAEFSRLDSVRKFSSYGGMLDAGCVGEITEILPFEPPLMWKGHIEKG